jgi:NhaA family Na+:H+ antiporter
MVEPAKRDEAGLPRAPIDRFLEPVVRFMHIEAASGVVLLACALTAVIWANSPAADSFLNFWKTEVGFTFGTFEFRHSLKHLINDGLMAIFFFVIGLEVKREIVLGELRDLRRAALPIAAAVGGMVVPAAIYLAIVGGGEGQRGWGIPMATDIAFVVGCMALLGSRVPHSLRIMVLSLAIADDIGAILVIAIGYTQDLNTTWLGLGVAGLGVVYGLGRVGVRSLLVYVVTAVLVWYAFHESGVHATIEGVILGFMTPARSYIKEGVFTRTLQQALQIFEGEGFSKLPHRAERVRRIRRITREAISPLEYLETVLHPWTSFVIMPIFALANAGVPLQLSDLGSPVAVAVMLGLVLGKPLGIVTFSWLAVRSGLARLPDGVNWPVLLAAGFLAGIGFTMALFIAGLALSGELLNTAKIGVLVGSAISALIGMTSLLVLLPKSARGTD